MVKFEIVFRGRIEVDAKSEEQAMERFDDLNKVEFMEALHIEEILQIEEESKKGAK